MTSQAIGLSGSKKQISPALLRKKTNKCFDFNVNGKITNFTNIFHHGHCWHTFFNGAIKSKGKSKSLLGFCASS